jgi:hypothetical protein
MIAGSTGPSSWPTSACTRQGRIREGSTARRSSWGPQSPPAASLDVTRPVGRRGDELRRLGRFPLLVIDEVGYIPFEADAANLLFQLGSARYERASVIITSNRPFGEPCAFRRTCARWYRRFTGQYCSDAEPAMWDDAA